MRAVSGRQVTPNRRGAKSRDAVLDAAERVMAEHGFEAATINRIVKESGIPLSSVYHYFGSKEGVLLAVMERGANRFFDDLSLPEIQSGRGEDNTDALTALQSALERHPDFLRLVLLLTAQPLRDDRAAEVREVVGRVRATALRLLAEGLAAAFELPAGSPIVSQLARFALAAIDGAFVAQQADPQAELAELLAPLPAALLGIVDALEATGRP